ncbi:hypothetical protein GQ44DRAFT_677226 [Phaeosphaeriaceae sp. PMI808]|nr:hypothetical protein GQ44DRAFT_677226 [Phaeosphaeriaceae sp. PMI808]
MPRFLHPKKSTEHRVAVIALYRALLSRCASVPLPDDHAVSLRNAIRNKFRRNRKLQGSYQLGLSFKAGYDACANNPQTLDHLDALSTGNTESVGILTRMISQLPHGLARTPRVKSISPSSSPPKEQLACLPTERAVLNVRPYLQTHGPRHVPIIASANGIPFLRLTKPQPPILSRIIRQRLTKKIKLFDMKVMLVNWWLPMAKQEDEWDALINWEAARGLDGVEDEVKWIDAVKMSERQNQTAYEGEQAKDREIIQKMQRVVDLETELALKEGQTIVRGRKRRPIKVIKPMQKP